MHNRLLSRLPADTLARLEPHVSVVELARGAELHAPHAPLGSVYFPETAIVALMHVPAHGPETTVGLVDRRGLVGVGVVLGSGPGPERAVVAVAGRALRLDAAHLLGEFDRSAPVRQMLLGWVQVVLTQVVQAGFCQQHHALTRRLCFRLDQLARAGGDDGARVDLTQQQLAAIVGGRREGINHAIGELQTGGLIENSRGRVRLLDRAGVVQHACACHGAWSDALRRARLGDG